VGLKHGGWLVCKRSHHLFCSNGVFEVISKRYVSLLESYACSARGYLVGGCNPCYMVADGMIPGRLASRVWCVSWCVARAQVVWIYLRDYNIG